MVSGSRGLGTLSFTFFPFTQKSPSQASLAQLSLSLFFLSHRRARVRPPPLHAAGVHASNFSVRLFGFKFVSSILNMISDSQSTTWPPQVLDIVTLFNNLLHGHELILRCFNQNLVSWGIEDNIDYVRLPFVGAHPAQRDRCLDVRIRQPLFCG